MSAKQVWLLLSASLVLDCAVVAPQSRIEPHERVAVEIRGSTHVDLAPFGLPVSASDLEQRFARIVTTRLARRRSIAPTPERANAILSLRLRDLHVTEHDGDRVSLRVTAAARIETGGEDPGKPRVKWRASEYETPARPRSDWTEGEGKGLIKDIETSFAEIADQIVLGVTRSGQSK